MSAVNKVRTKYESKTLMELAIKIKEREFRAGLRAAKEFNKVKFLLLEILKALNRKMGLPSGSFPSGIGFNENNLATEDTEDTEKKKSV